MLITICKQSYDDNLSNDILWEYLYPYRVITGHVYPAHFDSEIISQTVEAQSSRVPTPLPDDPYVEVRQEHLVDTNTESGPVEDLRETEAHTPATVDTESEPKEAPSKTEEFEASEPSDTRITSSHSSASSDSTAPLSPDHPLTQTSPTPTPT
ncbi:hypothetical protein Tco_1564363 [Tanacetum coccineum]